MSDEPRALPDALEPTRLGVGRPWAFALNETAASGEVEVTLLTLAVVADVLRVSGVVRVRGRRDMPGERPFALAHEARRAAASARGSARPPGCMRVGVSWVFARPKRIPAGYEGRIEHIELVHRAGGRVDEDTGVPWAFGFRLPRRPRPMRLAGQIG